MEVGRRANESLVQEGGGLGLWVLREHCKGLSGRRKCYVGDDSWKQQKGRGEGEMSQEKELVRYETRRNDSKKNLRSS